MTKFDELNYRRAQAKFEAQKNKVIASITNEKENNFLSKAITAQRHIASLVKTAKILDDFKDKWIRSTLTPTEME